MTPRIYHVYPAIFVPVVLTPSAVGLGGFVSWLSLAAIPLIWLGAFCSAPNLNLADRCLSSLAIVLGLVLTIFCKPLGIATTAGAMSGYYLSALEKIIRWDNRL